MMCTSRNTRWTLHCLYEVYIMLERRSTTLLHNTQSNNNKKRTMIEKNQNINYSSYWNIKFCFDGLLIFFYYTYTQEKLIYEKYFSQCCFVVHIDRILFTKQSGTCLCTMGLWIMFCAIQFILSNVK